MEKFIPGQRWYSDNEPELGLGTVQAVEPRLVQLYFPAIDEQRLYRIQDAPLSRLRFAPHDIIIDKAGNKLHVHAVEEHTGLLTYLCQDEQGRDYPLEEADLDSRLQLSRPQDRLLGGHLDPPRLYQLRQTTRTLQHELLPAPARGLLGCRVDLIPHQLYIANEVARRPSPRVLLADEVGLGKTIEAGLIMHRQLLDERIGKVLILVPESLLHQWLVEMLRRFNLQFSLLDEERCMALENNQENPFDSTQLVLSSMEMFLRNSERQRQALASNWDMLVVDEAHHLEWTPDTASPGYLFVEQLARQCPGVLLLTATPEQLGAAGHFARLRLLDPHRFFDLDAFLEEEASYQPIIDAVNELLEGHVPGEASRQALHTALGQHPTFDSLMQRLQQPANDERQAAEQQRARQQLIHLLVDRHGTGRVLFRNTRSAIRGFPERRLLGTSLPLPDEYATLYNSLDKTGSAELVRPEDVWQDVNGMSDGWLKLDPRISYVIETLRQYRGEKFLLICARADTAVALERHLRERIGIRTAVFHEGLTIIERDRAAAYFAEQDNGAQLLICSEIGSEGRNFQFAHHLIMFDLPYHPDLLEQRIGRLDRIGQSQTVKIHVGYFAESPQASLFRLYHEALDAFEHPCATGASLFARFASDIDQMLNTFPVNPSRLDELIGQVAAAHQKLVIELEQGRDRLLELNSYRSEEADYLLDAIRHQDNDPRLLDYLEQACSHFGVELEPHGPDSYVMRPGDHMLIEHLPHLPADGLTFTSSRPTALAREDWQFMSWEHPLMHGLMALILEEQYGNATLGIIRDKRYPAGTLLLECNYILEGTAPRHLQLHRFLPPTGLRQVLDENGTDCSARFAQQGPSLIPLDRATSIKILRARQDQLREMLHYADQLVQEPARTLLDKATSHVQQVMTTEISRLQHLAQINPNVRDDEIEELKTRQKSLLQYLSQVEPRLDAVCLLITG